MNLSYICDFQLIEDKSEKLLRESIEFGEEKELPKKWEKENIDSRFTYRNWQENSFIARDQRLSFIMRISPNQAISFRSQWIKPVFRESILEILV